MENIYQTKRNLTAENARLTGYHFPSIVTNAIFLGDELRDRSFCDIGAGPNTETESMVRLRGGSYTPLDIRHEFLDAREDGREHEGSPGPRL